VADAPELPGSAGTRPGAPTPGGRGDPGAVLARWPGAPALASSSRLDSATGASPPAQSARRPAAAASRGFCRRPEESGLSLCVICRAPRGCTGALGGG
jgi:hypothetical protein